MQLNSEQMSALEKIQNGGNYFITGKSGAGKTTLIKALAELPDIVFCAPTGAAARLIGGQTVHRLFQIPPYPAVDVTALTPLGRLKRKLLRQTKTIVIDEISMLRGDILNAIDYRLRQCARTLEDAQKPFGAKSMIFVGDFFQLPPVVNGVSASTPDLEAYHEQIGVYAFQTACWKCANIKPIFLKQIMRQSDDEFIKILNSIRTNEEDCIIDVLEKLNTRVCKDIPEKAVYLCSTRHLAATINATHYAKIAGEARTFYAKVSDSFNPKDYPNDRELQLKIGQRVIATAGNRDVCTGDIGTITGFSETGVLVDFDTGTEIEILPFETPQYSFKTDKDENGEDRIFIFQSGSFVQIPLIPGYAITIHRSQGMTLPQVVLDIGAGCFASGQLYVAISRCRSLDSLYLKQEITPDDIFIDEDVIAEECFWKIDNYLIHKILFEEFSKLNSWHFDLLSLNYEYARIFLELFISNYLDSFDYDVKDEYTELLKDDYLIYLEENLYNHACNLHLNRPVDISDLLDILEKLKIRFRKLKNISDNT